VSTVSQGTKLILGAAAMLLPIRASAPVWESTGAAVVSAASAPGDAAMFRGGPARTGVYEAGAGQTLVGLQWRVATGGDVISSPTVAGNVVYIGSGDGKLYALDRATGATKWTYDARDPIASSPAIGGGLAYAGTRDGHFFAVDVSTGAERWRFGTGKLMPFPWGHESGDIYTSSPAFVDGVVYFGAGDGRVYAVDAATGKEKWHAQTGGRVRSSPALDTRNVYVGAADGRVYAFDRATGAERWRYDTEGVKLLSQNFGYDRRTVQASPAVRNGVVYIGARDGFLYAIDAASGKLKWSFDHQISWVNTSPAVSDGVVYAGSSDAQFVQAVNTSTGKEEWRTKTGTTWSSPAIAGGVVYTGDGQGRLNAVDQRTGKALWFFRTPSQVFSSPTPTGDLVIFGSTDGSVYALRVSGGPPVKRAVFFDSTYLKVASVDDPSLLGRYMANRGYESLDASALGTWLEARIADKAPSVLVFAVDYLPNVAGDSTTGQQSLLRRYLDAGGKVVWPGIPPLLFPRDSATGIPKGGLLALNWTAPTKLLGVDHGEAMFDLRGVRATDAGLRWGLPQRWRTGWGIAIDPSITVLGRDEWGLAGAWVKRYGGGPGTGFVRIPADTPMTVYLAAEYRG
jgi:eukaryotic-like serine/threonine-protein kinase